VTTTPASRAAPTGSADEQCRAKYGEYAKGMGVTEEFLAAFNTRLRISIDRVRSTPPND
jgi:hypothetical protein